jgi:hypothetical protein
VSRVEIEISDNTLSYVIIRLHGLRRLHSAKANSSAFLGLQRAN